MEEISQERRGDRMVTSGASLLVVARPGRLRQGLQALLRTIPEIEIVGQADCDAEALVLIVQQQPSLVLLDSSLAFPDVLTVLAEIKRAYPQIRCIVLVENVQQQGAAREEGADVALITGFSAKVLHAAIHDLLVSVSKPVGAQDEG